MSDKTVLINKAKLRELIGSTLADQTTHKVGLLLNNAKQRLASIKAAGGCNCRKGPQRSIVYQEVLTQLKSMGTADLHDLKQYLNATTLNLGDGRQI